VLGGQGGNARDRVLARGLEPTPKGRTLMERTSGGRSSAAHPGERPRAQLRAPGRILRQACFLHDRPAERESTRPKEGTPRKEGTPPRNARRRETRAAEEGTPPRNTRRRRRA